MTATTRIVFLACFIPQLASAAAAAKAAEDVPQQIRLTSQDALNPTRVDRDKAVALSGLIRTALEDDATADEVKIPGVMGEHLAWIGSYIQGVRKPLLPSLILPLLQAANYMNMQLLLHEMVDALVPQLRSQITIPTTWPLDLQIIPLTAKERKEGVPAIAEVGKLPKELRELIAQKFFLKTELDIDKLLQVKTYTPYEQLVAHGFIPAVFQKEFPNLKANPNGVIKDEGAKGRTALTHVILSHDFFESTRLRLFRGLLRLKGIDLNMPDQTKNQLTPLTAVLFAGRPAFLPEPLQAGADPNRADGMGRTPLWYALDRGTQYEIDLLKQAGAKK